MITNRSVLTQEIQLYQGDKLKQDDMEKLKLLYLNYLNVCNSVMKSR